MGETPPRLDGWRAEGTVDGTGVVIQPVSLTIKRTGSTENGTRTCVTVEASAAAAPDPRGLRSTGAFTLCDRDLVSIYKTQSMSPAATPDSLKGRYRAFADDPALVESTLTPATSAAILDLGESVLEIHVGPDCVRLLGPDAISDAPWILRATEVAVALRLGRDPTPAVPPPPPGMYFASALFGAHIGATLLASFVACMLYAVSSAVQPPIVTDPIRALACAPDEHLGSRTQKVRRGNALSLACFSTETESNEDAQEIFFVPFFYFFNLTYFPLVGLFFWRSHRMGRKARES